MTPITIKFQKVDQYKNLIFIAKSEMPEEQETFKRLTNFHNTHKDEITTFLPIYATPIYATLRCKPNPKFQHEEGAIYTLDLSIRKKKHEEKNYIHIYINKSTLVKKSNLDLGELIEF
tara:strand:+ start:396 stop:749 length:354 start_codon:yes stop_codon:yes gene_type:complete